MSSTQPSARHLHSSRGLGASAVAALLLACAALVSPALAQDWANYADESATRISAASGVGTGDAQEKDLAIADLDNDGDLDLVVARKEPFSTPGGNANVLFMNESGVMTDRTAALAPDFADEEDDRDIILIDVDGDGWVDAVTATTFADQPRIYMNLGEDELGAWQGLDYNAADNRIPAFTPAPKFCAVAAGDVNGDGAPDLFFVDYDNNLEDRLLINDGNGFFTDQTATRMTAAMSESVFGTDAHILDMNGDGFADILKNTASGSNPPPGSTPPSVRILYNDGTGNFDFLDVIYEIDPYMTEVADFNKDGRYDVFVVDDGQDHYLINTGNDAQGHATFNIVEVTGSPSTTFFGGNTKFGDLDSDGILDVIVADVDTDLPGCTRRTVALQGQGAAPNVAYTDPLNGNTRSWMPAGVFDIEIFDINGDGIQDIWAGTCTGNKVFIGTGNPLLDDEIFTEGFDVPGDLTNWSSTRTNEGALAVTAGAALSGAAGLQLDVVDQDRMYVVDESPAQELHYRMRFYIDPNDLVFPSNKRFKIFTAFQDAPRKRLFTGVFRGNGGQYFLRVKAKGADETWSRLDWVEIPNEPTAIEIEWRKARSPGFLDGQLRLWVGGNFVGEVTLDNYAWHLDFLRLGAVGGLDVGTSGTYYIDAFESRRQDEIGLLP